MEVVTEPDTWLKEAIAYRSLESAKQPTPEKWNAKAMDYSLWLSAIFGKNITDIKIHF